MSRKGQKAVSEVSGASLVGSETFDDRIYIMIKIVKVSHHYRNIFVDGVFTAMMFKNVYGNWILQYGGQNHIFDSVAEARKFLPKIFKSAKKVESAPVEPEQPKCGQSFPKFTEDGYATTVVLADGRRCTRYHVEDYEALVTALEKGRI